jgi:glycosyltransferase involved in cell wall biosynthesis
MTGTNIAVISADYPEYLSGYSDYAFRLIQSLQKIRSGIFCVTTDHPAIRRTDASLRMRWRLGMFPRLVRFLRQEECGIVIIQYPNILYGKYSLVPHLYAVLLRVLGFTIITTLHEHSNIAAARRLSEAVFILISHRLILTSEVELKSIVRMYGALARAKATVIPIGSNIDRVTTHPATGSNVIMTFGVFYPGRCVEEVINVMEQIDRESGGEYVFRFVGAIHEQYTEYFAKCRAQAEMKLQRCEWIINKPLEEVSAAFTDVFMGIVLYNDGASIRRGSLFALMTNGIPVLSRKMNESAELAGVEQNGLFYIDDTECPAVLRVNALRSDHELYTNCFTTLRAFSDNFSFDTIAQEYLAVCASARHRH